MTALSIKLSGGHGKDRVPARLSRIDVRSEEGDAWFRDIRIVPDDPTTLEVVPGQYLIEAFWRSGRMTSHRLAIEDSSSEFVLVPPISRRQPKPSDRDFSQPSAGGMFRSSRRSNDGHGPSVFRSCKETWALLRDRHAMEQESNITAEHRPVRRLHDVNVPGTDGVRSWVLYWAADGWAVSSLPPSSRDEVVLRSDPVELPYIAASDPDLGVMTDLLPAGNTEAAHRYASVAYAHARNHHLEHMLLHQPLALCAFAYAEYETFNASEWTKALEAAATPYGDIPDIFVLLGWRMLMAARSEDDWCKAGSLFERAVQVGVPFYSLGVRLLAEGLTMIAPSFPGHERSATLVRSVAARIVPTEAFTTVRL